MLTFLSAQFFYLTLVHLPCSLDSILRVPRPASWSEPVFFVGYHCLGCWTYILGGAMHRSMGGAAGPSQCGNIRNGHVSPECAWCMMEILNTNPHIIF